MGGPRVLRVPTPSLPLRPADKVQHLSLGRIERFQMVVVVSAVDPVCQESNQYKLTDGRFKSSKFRGAFHYQSGWIFQFLPEKKDETVPNRTQRVGNNNLRSKNNIDYTVDVVISRQTLDFGFSRNAKIAVSIRQRQTEAIRGTLQPAVIIALPTNADSLLQLNNIWL